MLCDLKYKEVMLSKHKHNKTNPFGDTILFIYLFFSLLASTVFRLKKQVQRFCRNYDIFHFKQTMDRLACPSSSIYNKECNPHNISSIFVCQHFSFSSFSIIYSGGLVTSSSKASIDSCRILLVSITSYMACSMPF